MDMEDVLFPVELEDIIFCILHARLRIVDEFLEILTARMKLEGPTGLDSIRRVAQSIGVPYEVYSEDGEETWRINGYNGLQALKILENIERFTALWPPRYQVSYEGLLYHELRREALSAINDGELAPQKLPRRKLELIALLQSIGGDAGDENETLIFTKVFTFSSVK